MIQEGEVTSIANNQYWCNVHTYFDFSINCIETFSVACNFEMFFYENTSISIIILIYEMNAKGTKMKLLENINDIYSASQRTLDYCFK